MFRVAHRAASLLAVLLLLCACGASPPTTPTKSGTAERRTDLAPITTRFADLGTVTGATWMSGTLGDDAVPGPSTYWIDAIVTLPPGAVDGLRAQYSATEAARQPKVIQALSADLPAGPLYSSENLDAALSKSGYRAEAYLAGSGDRVVLIAVGQ